MSNRSILREIAELRKGKLQDELSQEYGRLVQQVCDTGRPGKITLTLTVAPLGKDSDMQQVKDEVKVVIPKVVNAPTLFFVDDHGNHRLADDDEQDDKKPALRSVSETKSDAASVN